MSAGGPGDPPDHEAGVGADPDAARTVFGPAATGTPGSTVLRPEDAERFTARLEDLERSVAAARDALRGLADVGLPLGSGQDNAAIGAWYRDLVTGAAAPAADELAREVDAVRRAVRDSVTAWEETDRDGAASFDDPPPS